MLKHSSTSCVQYALAGVLNAAYDEIINSLSATADDHIANAEGITSQVLDALTLLERRSAGHKRKVCIGGPTFGTEIECGHRKSHTCRSYWRIATRYMKIAPRCVFAFDAAQSSSNCALEQAKG
jgi:hypothetical protein